MDTQSKVKGQDIGINVPFPPCVADLHMEATIACDLHVSCRADCKLSSHVAEEKSCAQDVSAADEGLHG